LDNDFNIGFRKEYEEYLKKYSKEFKDIYGVDYTYALDKFDKDINNAKNRIKDAKNPRSYDRNAIYSEIATEMQDNKSNPHPLWRYIIELIGSDFKKSKSKNLKNYVEYKIDNSGEVNEERIKTWMPKMTEPVIKKSCKLGGKKDGTSDDCSQGDTGAVSYKKIKDGQSHKPNKPNVAEEEKWFDRSINEGRVPYGRTYWGWISPEGEFYEVPKLKHAEFITRRYPDEYWDLDATFDKAFADGWLRVIYEKDGFSGALSINGDNEEKIKDAILKYYQDLVKYGANSIYVDAGDGGKSFYTGSKEGKEKVTSYLTEKEELNEVGEANIEPYQITADVVQDDGMEFSFTTEGGQEYVIQAGFNIIPKQYFIEDENMSDADQSFFYGEMPSKMVNLSISYTLREHHEKLRDARPATYMDNVRDRFGKGKDQEDNYPTVNTGEPLKIMSTISLATKAAYKKAVEKFGIVNMISYVPKRDKENDLRRERMNQIFVEKGLQKNGIPIKKKIKTGGQILYIISDGEMRMGESETQGVEESYINNMNEDIMSLQQLPFQKEIKGMGGKIYSVGGAVRDEFLGKDSKDLDILITGVPMEKLEMILDKYGEVDAVGKSFGILKFVPQGSKEDIDVAIPRTEFATGEGGHKGFEVASDHSLPIEKDLERRDFTINAIAKDIDGNIIDPFGGQEDLQNKIIKVVNPEAFSDDPLRMLRAVQFAARFGFKIEPNTMRMIRQNAPRIKEIAPERILTEFDKIVQKGDAFNGAFLLKRTGLLKNIFDSDAGLLTSDVWDKVRTMGEFIYLLSNNLVDDPAKFYKNKLKGDIPTFKEIQALEQGIEKVSDNEAKNRLIVNAMFGISPESIDSGLLPDKLRVAVNDLKSGKYPLSLKQLAVNGNDLMQLGLKGREIGETLKKLLFNVYSDNLPNEKETMLNFLNRM